MLRGGGFPPLRQPSAAHHPLKRDKKQGSEFPVFIIWNIGLLIHNGGTKQIEGAVI